MPGLIFHQSTTAKTRREMLNGVEHLIVPTVAFVEGVLNDELVLASEIEDSFQSWNGRPVMLGHPTVNGVFVSANDPEILDALSFGRLFNTQLDGAKLKQEMWIPLQMALAKGDDFKEAIERFESGEMVDVSTAYVRDVEEKAGEFNGQKFEAVARNIRPDHLAILLHEPGACSLQDGCGAPRVNADLMTNPFPNEHAVQTKEAEEVENETVKPNALERIKSAVAVIAGAVGININLEVNEVDELKAQIVADGRFGFSVDDVAAMSDDALRKLAKFLDDNPAAEQDDVEDEIEDILDEEDVIEDMAEDEDEEDEKPPPSTNVQAPCDQFADFGGPEKALETLKAHQVNETKQKTELITALVANELCLLSSEQLSEMTMPTLKAVQKSFTPADFSGQSGGIPAVNSGEPYKQPSLFEAGG